MLSKRSEPDLIIHNSVREQSSKTCSETGACNVLPPLNLEKHQSVSHRWHRRERTGLQLPQSCSGHQLTNSHWNPSFLLTAEEISWWCTFKSYLSWKKKYSFLVWIFFLTNITEFSLLKKPWIWKKYITKQLSSATWIKYITCCGCRCRDTPRCWHRL